jgi:hypothetical protein
LLLLLLFGALLGGSGVWLKGRVEGNAVAAHSGMDRAWEPAPAADFDADLARAQRDAARCLGKSARPLRVRFTLQSGAPSNVQLSGTVLATTEEECVRHAFNSLRASASAERTIDCDVNPEPTL